MNLKIIALLLNAVWLFGTASTQFYNPPYLSQLGNVASTFINAARNFNRGLGGYNTYNQDVSIYRNDRYPYTGNPYPRSYDRRNAYNRAFYDAELNVGDTITNNNDDSVNNYDETPNYQDEFNSQSEYTLNGEENESDYNPEGDDNPGSDYSAGGDENSGSDYNAEVDENSGSDYNAGGDDSAHDDSDDSEA